MMNSGKPICIDVREATRSFGSKEILHRISLSVRLGEIFGLLGPSGTGKTTLVKIIAGIDQAQSGQITVLGTVMPKLDMLLRIGYMAQSDAMYPELTAKENMEFFGALSGLKKPVLRRRMKEVMELVDLEEHLNKSVSSFSGGMKRRLSLAIALLHQPEVLILDEPTVGIDPLLRASIWAELNQLSASGVTILLTTHVMDEADKCHQLAMIRDGSLIASGTPDELQKTSGGKTLEDAFLFYGGKSL